MQNKIFNQLNHEPLVWGVPFTPLMILLTSLVLTTTIFMQVFAIGTGIVAAAGLHLAIYLVLVQYFRMDKLEWLGRLQRAVKKEIDSLSKSTQRLVIK